MKLTSLLARAGMMLAASLALPTLAAEKPNILVFWGDDIGITNISAYSDGIMGYRMAVAPIAGISPESCNILICIHFATTSNGWI